MVEATTTVVAEGVPLLIVTAPTGKYKDPFRVMVAPPPKVLAPATPRRVVSLPILTVAPSVGYATTPVSRGSALNTEWAPLNPVQS